ncbi:MAG: hypothetical protein HY344_00445 [Candidatus Levybacteria bacterium]|nr:hypothetical protein [Candidatus Levybacteria bacterium]
MKNLKTEILALANYADFSKDGKLSIIGIFDRIFTKETPSSFIRGFLVFSISGGENNSKHLITVIIKDSSGKIILEKKVEIVMGSSGKGNFIAELVGLPLPVFGEYKVILKTLEKEIGNINFFVTLPDQVVNNTPPVN